MIVLMIEKLWKPFNFQTNFNFSVLTAQLAPQRVTAPKELKEVKMLFFIKRMSIKMKLSCNSIAVGYLKPLLLLNYFFF